MLEDGLRAPALRLLKREAVLVDWVLFRPVDANSDMSLPSVSNPANLVSEAS